MINIIKSTKKISLSDFVNFSSNPLQIAAELNFLEIKSQAAN